MGVFFGDIFGGGGDGDASGGGDGTGGGGRVVWGWSMKGGGGVDEVITSQVEGTLLHTLTGEGSGDANGEGKGDTLQTICSQVSFPGLCNINGVVKLRCCNGRTCGCEELPACTGNVDKCCEAVPIMRYLQLVSRCLLKLRA